MWKQKLRQSNLLRILCQKLTVSLDMYFLMVALSDSYAGITPCDKKLISDFDYELQPNLIEYVGELANESYNHKKECSSLDIFITALFAIGAKSSELYDKSRLISPFTSSEVIEELNAISKNIGNNSDCIENLLNKLINSLKNDELFQGNDFFTDSEHKTTYLELFKKNYDSSRTK